MSPKRETLGEKIKRIRGETYQADFGKRLGVSQGTVSAWERDDKDRLPSADMHFRLAAIASRPEDQIFFLQQAGLSRETIISAANELVKEQIARPKEGEMVVVRPVEQSWIKGQEPPPGILFASALSAKPMLTRYFTVDEYSSGYGFETGDILLLDISQVDTPSLMPFWEQPILAEHTDPANCSRKEQIVGRLFLRESRHEAVPPLAFHAFYDGMLQPWTNLHHEMGEMRGRPMKGYHPGDHLKDSGPFVITYGDQGSVEDADADIETSFAALRKQAQAKIRLYPEWRILGRVTGWFRPSSEGGE